MGENTNNSNIFEGTHSVRDLTKYMLLRGVTDFGNLEQFNLFESGYSFLVVIGIPTFLEKLCASSNSNEEGKNASGGNAEYSSIIKTYAHILEYEFRGLSGIEGLSTETGELTNGINTINIINKVNKQNGSSFSMTYQEKLGSVITKAHELYLTGIKDPRTQVKTYHGLITGEYKTATDGNTAGKDGTTSALHAGYENEVFKLMYIVTDNTLFNIERAFYIAAAQPTGADLTIYEAQTGTYEFKDINVEFNGYPINSKTVTKYARTCLDSIRNATIWRESDKNYTLDVKTSGSTTTTNRIGYNTLMTDKNTDGANQATAVAASDNVG